MHSTAQHSTAQHSTAQHSTAQHSTAQHSTAQRSAPHLHDLSVGQVQRVHLVALQGTQEGILSRADSQIPDLHCLTLNG